MQRQGNRPSWADGQTESQKSRVFAEPFDLRAWWKEAVYYSDDLNGLAEWKVSKQYGLLFSLGTKTPDELSRA